MRGSFTTLSMWIWWWVLNSSSMVQCLCTMYRCTYIDMNDADAKVVYAMLWVACILRCLSRLYLSHVCVWAEKPHTSYTYILLHSMHTYYYFYYYYFDTYTVVYISPLSTLPPLSIFQCRRSVLLPVHIVNKPSYLLILKIVSCPYTTHSNSNLITHQFFFPVRSNQPCNSSCNLQI